MVNEKRTGWFAALASFFFRRWRYSLLLWVFMLSFGAAAYTQFIKREGFPPIQFPVAYVTGVYNVPDKDIVDDEVARPFYDLIKDIDGVSEVTTNAFPQFFNGIIFFEEGVAAEEGSQRVREAIKNSDRLPAQAQFDVVTIDPASFLNEFDVLLSVYSTEPATLDQLEEVAEFVATEFENDPLITNAEAIPLQTTAPNRETGTPETYQSSFNRVGLPDDGRITFYSAVTVGIDRDAEQLDVIELSELIHQRMDSLDLARFGDQYRVVIGADFAESIQTQISSLESNLFTGLLAVAMVSLLLITWRASIITGLFMVTVMAVTVAILYLVGYTLNTITLFALVLALGLFVDDATIVVESIDAHRRKDKKPLDIVKEAVSKIGAASFAGTFTTVLVFLPMAFLSGILGEFIRLMPVTVIIALITSLVLSMTLIPVLARFVLLRQKKQDWFAKTNPITRAEAWLGHRTGALSALLRKRPKLGKKIAVFCVLLSVGSVVIAFGYAGQVEFNIFPPSKDSDQIGYNSTYPPGYTIEQAEAVASQIDQIVAEEVGPLAEKVTYGSYSITQPNNRSSDALITLVPFTERERQSPEIVDTLQRLIDERVPDGMQVKVQQYDAGPPASDYPLTIQIYEEDPQAAAKLAEEVRSHIDGAEVTRANGIKARINETKPAEAVSLTRNDGRRVTQISGAFDAEDTSALLVAAQEHVEKRFTPEYLQSNGYSADALGFDFGQESENADSFASLAYAFPIALLLMYILLAVQFRSFLQPLLIFMAIPFTFLGVFAGLYYTDNALSFFVQVGLIGLIGIAVNNTILLTTYANQERNAGERSIEAIANAVTKRFRPLVATTLTTVVALLPLALTDPFWEPLAFTIIFGLISSTFFVLIAFPYYYLAAEWARRQPRSLITKMRRR